MGGHAYIIPGEVEARLLPDPDEAPAALPPVSFWRRLFGGASSARPETSRVISLPNGDRHFEIQPAQLEGALAQSLRNWVRGRLSNPSRASATILEYLSGIEPSVYVRGAQQAGQQRPEFYVQVSFSGCAGEAETSARAAAHWAALWYKANYRQIAAEYLVPFGFTPDQYRAAEEERLIFLPAGDLGYLEYTPPAARYADQTAFDLDNSVAEANEADPRLANLEESFGGFMKGNVCRCQLCDPGFGDAKPEVA